jgi:Bardet-Biedl syndrome 9 protein
MVIGKFGRSKNDLICVQTLNGQLQILDQGKELFTCRLSDTIVPGPLAYVPRTDTIVTISSSRYLDGYRYQSLSTRSQTKKPFKADWSLSLGEPVLDIKSIMLDDSHSVLLILGERNVFCLKETGAIVFSLRLDTYFTTIFPYSSTYTGDGDHISCMFMLAGHSQQLQVFNNQVMVWSAQLTHPPVSLHVGQFDGLDGVVVTLDELGHLQCSYLGTDPTSLLPTFTALTSASVEELEGELKQLQSAIDEADQSQYFLSSSPYLSLTLSLTIIIEGAIISTDCVIEVKSVIYSEPRPLESEDGLNQQCVQATVTLKSSNSFKINLTVFVDVAPPISAHPTSLSLNVTDDDKFILTFVCSGDSGWPDTNKANIILSYDNQNHTHTIDHTLSLPIGLLCKPVQPQDGQYKVTQT